MKVDMKEVHALKDKIEKQKAKIQTQLDTAKDSLGAISESDALAGQVKKAINSDINNHQKPILTNYYDVLFYFSKEMKSQIKSFKETVDEKSSTAVIDSDALTQVSSKFGKKGTDFGSIQSRAKSAYNSIDDIISLRNPSSNGVQVELGKTKKVLTNTNKWLAEFNSKKPKNTVEELLAQQQKELNSLNETVGLSFTDPAAMTVFNNKEFKKEINKQDKKVRAAELKEIEKMGYYEAAKSGRFSEKALIRSAVSEANEYMGAAGKGKSLGKFAGQVWTARGTRMNSGGGIPLEAAPESALVKYGGRTLNGVSFASGMADDMINKNKNWGQAVMHNGTKIAVSSAAGTLVTLATGPVGWGIIASMGVGMAFEYAYSRNVMGTRDILDQIGDGLTKAVDKISNSRESKEMRSRRWHTNLNTN